MKILPDEQGGDRTQAAKSVKKATTTGKGRMDVARGQYLAMAIT